MIDPEGHPFQSARRDHAKLETMVWPSLTQDLLTKELFRRTMDNLLEGIKKGLSVFTLFMFLMKNRWAHFPAQPSQV